MTNCLVRENQLHYNVQMLYLFYTWPVTHPYKVSTKQQKVNFGLAQNIISVTHLWNGNMVLMSFLFTVGARSCFRQGWNCYGFLTNTNLAAAANLRLNREQLQKRSMLGRVPKIEYISNLIPLIRNISADINNNIFATFSREALNDLLFLAQETRSKNVVRVFWSNSDSNFSIIEFLGLSDATIN